VIGQILFNGCLTILLMRRYDEAYKASIALSKELSETNKACQTFVPFEFLSFIKKDKITDVSLGDSSRQDMAILFSDIRSFTTLSEKMSERENFDFINAYLKEMEPCIRANNGFIDKYIGDAIMALFPGSADNALRAAISMYEQLAVFNEKSALQGINPIKAGWGLHFGSLMLGILGSESRMEGTVISDAVNLAGRIEGLTKNYEPDILLSRQLLDNLITPNAFNTVFLDRMQVKGRSQLENIYGVIL